jgi:hypothetical protein
MSALFPTATWSSPVDPSAPTLATFGQGLAALYFLQHWESMHPERLPDGPYAPSYFTKRYPEIVAGLANDTLKTVLHHIGHARCACCATSIDVSKVDRADHIIANHWGGKNVHWNLLLLCRSCNSSKGTRDLLEWWMYKSYPVMQMPRAVLCLYTRAHWQHFGVQVHLEPLPAWMEAFLVARAAALPSEAHRQALYHGARLVTHQAQQPTLLGIADTSRPPAHLSYYGMAMQ